MKSLLTHLKATELNEFMLNESVYSTVDLVKRNLETLGNIQY